MIPEGAILRGDWRFLQLTLWADPNWRAGRGIVFGTWLVSLAGSALALAPLPVTWRPTSFNLPVSETARTLAVLEATVGQFYIAVVVAVFVGMYAAQRRGT